MRDCEIWDNNKVQIYLEGTRHAVVDGCLIYCTSQIESGDHSNSEGIHIASELYPQGAWVCEDIEITNNLIVGCGPNLKMAGGLHRGTPVTDWGMRNFRVFHNTFVNARANACLVIGNQSPADNNKNNTQSWFANNIIVQEDSLPITSSFSGTNYSKFTFSHNVWSKQPRTEFRDAATDTVGSAGLVDPPLKLARPSDMKIGDYELTAGSAAVNAATKTYDTASGTSVTVDYFDSTRGASPDRGFHEYGGTGAEKILVAGYSTSPGSTINAGEAITFSDNSTTGGGVSITSREWVFDGGSTPSLTAASPVVTYAEPGVYDVTYTVHDSVNNRHSIASGTVTVKAEDGGDIAPLKTNVVNFAGGAASFAHGLDSPPKAILFFMGRATADDTPVDGAGMSIGMYAANGSATISTINPAGAPDKQSLRKLAGGAVLEDLEADVTAEVTAVSDSAVSLAWTGSPGAHKCMALCFAGGGVSGATVDIHEFSSSISASKTGAYNLLFAIGAGTPAGSQKWGAAMSFGMAAINNNQGVVAFSEPRGSGLKAIAQYDWVSYYPTLNWGVSADFLNGYRLAAAEKSNSAVAVLAMTIDADVLVQLYATPTTTDAKEYGAVWLIDFDPATMLAVLSNLPSRTLAAGENAGYFGVYATDGTDERTIGVTNEDAALPVGSSSITDDGWVQRADDGSALMSGSVALGTEKFTMTMTDADTTERMFLALLLEGTVTNTAPNAEFALTWEGKKPTDTNPPMGVEITFNNLSTAGAAALDTYAWDFGDGSDESAVASPTHTYERPGTFTVTLIVTDADEVEASEEKDITVLLAAPDFVVTLDKTKIFVPDTVEIDASGTTWGDLEIDWEKSRIGLSYEITDDISTSGWTFYAPTATDGVGEILIEQDALYKITMDIHATTGEVWRTSPFGRAVEGFEDALRALPNSNLWLNQWPPYAEFVGPMERWFEIRGNRQDTHYSLYTWDMGDGTTLEGQEYNVWHTYAAVDEVTSYDITVDILYADDEEEEQFVATGAVTVYPPTVPPIPLQTIAAQWQTYREHVGDLTGAVWTRQDAPNDNVYKTELSHQWAANMTPRLYENGEALTARASVALCQANPGSYYPTNAAGEIVIYVHPSQSDNTNLNGNAYRWVD
jgi:PKD repeat protein